MAGVGNTQEDGLTVVVSGDVTMDWNLAQDPLSDADEPDGVRASWQRGGAALLADLVRAVGAALPDDGPTLVVQDVNAPSEPIAPGHHELNHSYAPVDDVEAAVRGACKS